MCPPHEREPDRLFLFEEPLPPWGPPFGFGRRRRHWPRRARRGDVRTGILAVLAEQPMHGYQIIQELESRSGGLWRPSPGSVYPTLQLLEDEGLVAHDEADGKRVYSLTDDGRARAEEARAGSERPPWEMHVKGRDETALRLRKAAFQVGAAAMQTAHAGSDEQAAKALDVLADARRRIYAILAENGEPTSTASP